MPATGWAALAAKQPLQPFSFEPRALGENDLEIAVTHCGVCHSDVSLVDNDWGFSRYPMVPGHEVVGTVTAVGSAAARRFRLGQRVGVGWQCNSCGECEYCSAADEHLCLSSQATCVHGYGGYADVLRVNSRFAIALPDDIDPAVAAPLLCGGITVYTPFHAFDLRPSMKVAVVGIGGLGHLALQFARAWGCEVTAISSTAAKEAEARRYGAQGFIASAESGALAANANRFDFVLSTVSAGLDWQGYLGLLKPKGTLCIVGVPDKPIALHAFPLIQGQRRIAGSPIGSPRLIRDMLELATRAGVAAQIERLPMDQVNLALDKVRRNEARYRMVLERAG